MPNDILLAISAPSCYYFISGTSAGCQDSSGREFGLQLRFSLAVVSGSVYRNGYWLVDVSHYTLAILVSLFIYASTNVFFGHNGYLDEVVVVGLFSTVRHCLMPAQIEQVCCCVRDDDGKVCHHSAPWNAGRLTGTLGSSVFKPHVAAPLSSAKCGGMFYADFWEDPHP
ncbi:hypothetical protein VKT23_018469 [Stygiomarasmius scandens]|uniref:Uncharacterized protein n=1 Tax=Marasmiellus scandens TaxID=2682957 RepID=A0ABR1IP59_9AGAR